MKLFKKIFHIHDWVIVQYPARLGDGYTLRCTTCGKMKIKTF